MCCRRPDTISYFHPWEIDPDQPRQVGLDAKTRFRHYLNLDRMEDRLDRLLGDFAWGRMDEVLYWPRVGHGNRQDVAAAG